MVFLLLDMNCQVTLAPPCIHKLWRLPYYVLWRRVFWYIILKICSASEHCSLHSQCYPNVKSCNDSDDSVTNPGSVEWCNLLSIISGTDFRMSGMNPLYISPKKQSAPLYKHWDCTGRTAHRGSRGIALLFIDHGTRKWEGGQRHAPAALYPRERPGSHCTGDWVGPRAGLDRCGKSRPHRDSIPGLSSP